LKAPIVLLTDFGTRDHYVGVMKGMILAQAPGARIVDLCHEVPPQDVRAGAYLLRVSVPYFPRGSLFVAVVDPGVGSARRILWARTARQQFLAPDNGILGWLEEPVLDRREVVRRPWMPELSATFHGRDVFAPVAARLARGLSPLRLGPRVREAACLPFPEPIRRGGGVRGEILAIDRFGNAATNLRATDIRSPARIFFFRRDLGAVRSHYAAVPQGSPVALIGSSGLLELSVRGGSFARRFGASPGDPVESRA